MSDRSSVGRFHKQFEESKILLEDYIATLRRSQRDKIILMALLSGSEVFYEVAQEEAKVIVNVSSNSIIAFFDSYLIKSEAGFYFPPGSI